MGEYLAVIKIVAGRVTRSIPYGFQARGTSEATALQEVARVALSHLRHDLTKLAQPSYYHLLMQAHKLPPKGRLTKLKLKLETGNWKLAKPD